MPYKNKLVQMLKDNERELLALKTSCSHGLGSASFYNAVDYVDFTVIPSSDNYLKVIVKLPDNFNYSPYCQCYISKAQYFQPMSASFNEEYSQMEFLFRCYLNNLTIRVYAKAICSAPIESITFTTGSL